MRRKAKTPQPSRDQHKPLPQNLMNMDFTIYLEGDGRVVISDLPPDLLDLVKELDPKAEIFCALKTLPKGKQAPTPSLTS